MSKKILFCIGLFLLTQLASADVYLVNFSKDFREYITVNRAGNTYSFKHLSQNRGDFQDILDKRSFETADRLNQYLLRNYKLAKKVNKLEYWPINNLVKNENDKGLFNKKVFVWEAQNNWNLDWEIKYSKWIESEVNTDFYSKYNISTDCADALVGLRWIFARMNSLPVANTLSDTDNLFGNFSMSKKWSKFSRADKWYEDELFLNVLSYVMDLTSTRTVVNDGYPIKLDRESMIAGTYLITLNNHGGHAKIISRTNYNNQFELPVFTFASTTPRAIRKLALEILVDQEWPNVGVKEILAFRWPVNDNGNWKLLDSKNHPHYSIEQFDQNLHLQYPAFINFLLERLKGTFDSLSIIKSGIDDLIAYTQQRIDIVNEGYIFCKKQGCSINSEGFDAYSTPERDAKLIKKFQDIEKLVVAFDTFRPGIKEYWNFNLRNSFIKIEGLNLTLSDVRYLFENNFYSSDPNLTTKERWGLSSDIILPKWLDLIQTKLVERNEIINRNLNCNTNCDSNSLNWNSGNTYSIDSELNKLYVQMRRYCTVAGIDSCLKNKSANASSVLEFNYVKQNLISWTELIPKFHSDPRVSLERRWGQIDSNSQFALLPTFEKISISKNKLGLLDEKKIIDLNTNTVKYIAPNGFRLVLTSNGSMYSIRNDFKQINNITFDNLGNIVSMPVTDPDNLLGDNLIKLIDFSEVNGHGVFKASVTDSIIAFKIDNNKIIFINEFKSNFQQSSQLIMMIDSNIKISFADLQRENISELTIDPIDNIRNLDKLNLIDYAYPIALLEYNDQEWGIHFLATFNFESKKLNKLSLPLIDNFQLKWASAKTKKLFVQTNVNGEFPALFAFSFLEGQILRQFNLSNSLGDVAQIDDSIFFVELKGAQWSNNVKSTLKKWTDIIIDYSPEESTPISIKENKAFLIGANKTQVIDLLTNNKSILAKQIYLSNDEEVAGLGITYRFDSSYGPNFKFGGGIDHINNLLILEEELIPNFSLYSWFNKENLIDGRWLNNLKFSSIQSGRVITIGNGVAYWWNASK